MRRMRVQHMYIRACARTLHHRARWRDKIFAPTGPARRGGERASGRGRTRERERERIEGARRNATGLSSPLINTSKATCKAARVGSRVQLNSGEPLCPFESSVHACHCFSLFFSFPLPICHRRVSILPPSLSFSLATLSVFLYHRMIRLLWLLLVHP